MRIDSHQHFWRFDEKEYSWIDDRMAMLRRDFMPEELAPILKKNGVHGSLAVQVRQSLEETDWLLEMARQNAFVRGVVGWVDLRSSVARRDLERYRDNRFFLGVRHLVQDEPDDRFLLREDFLAGVSILKELDLTFDILIYPRQLPAAIEFVRRFPDHRLVLDHLAKPPIARGEVEPWASFIRELSSSENLFCKVSGMVTEASWTSWTRDDFIPYLDVVFEAFGSGRLMFGSDWPVCRLAARYDEVMQVVVEYLDTLSSDEKGAVLGGNAIDFYRLGRAPNAD
ncbi:MAG TPA: amidohydrolase family protein [Vicinamibacteria bacterium]|nr:amidohydrolase family protein [Vicinamibacteria bacterium]